MLDYSQQNLWPISSGHLQSPINILTTQTVKGEELSPKLHIHYQNQLGQKIANPQNLQLGQANSRAILNGRSFTFKQVHFHTTSEHLLDGQSFPLEGHFVHQAPDGCLAVLAVFYQLGAENAGFQSILAGLTSTQAVSFTHFPKLLPENKSYYHYRGSLTTPPLIEGVEWYIFQEILTISAEQLTTFTKLQGTNTRKLQPQNGRVITEYTAE